MLVAYQNMIVNKTGVQIMRKFLIFILFLPLVAQATPTIDATYNADIVLLVGCALMFGFGVLVGK